MPSFVMIILGPFDQFQQPDKASILVINLAFVFVLGFFLLVCGLFDFSVVFVFLI